MLHKLSVITYKEPIDGRFEDATAAILKDIYDSEEEDDEDDEAIEVNANEEEDDQDDEAIESLSGFSTLIEHARTEYQLLDVCGRIGAEFALPHFMIMNLPNDEDHKLSDLGLVSYRGYWTRTLLSILQEREDSISIKELSDLTMIKPDDIISTLQHLEMIQYRQGQHVICAAPHAIEAHLKACGSPGLLVEPKKIIWQVRISSS